jgi:hypothetical protein
VRKSLLIVLCTLALLACEKREDFPPKYDITIPPQPYNLSVTYVEAQRVYDLTWEIDDPDQLVEEYFVYLSSGLAAPDTIGTTTTTSFTYNWPLNLSGLIFGVTSVSDENVESDPATAVTE